MLNFPGKGLESLYYTNESLYIHNYYGNITGMCNKRNNQLNSYSQSPITVGVFNMAYATYSLRLVRL
jgi:hypothetical protein